ncbi:hypothetical protein RI444_22545 (plasmid) [Paenarthrobacter sp. AT5]|uniref:hypothetical protein n=1 Tax=Paenarthrobacter sp. AT5 TaxID=2973089 RepID=UPI0029352539|nr:hypothetical protein [Paenarthrobacter sp. AT5]WOC63437.1 hypothetical protein RI444_22545 [Paenarthrobacter sp. AT5]
MKDIAEVWQPSRLKGIVVRAGAGLPFLSAGQVFEAVPVVRKWLARGHVPDEAGRYVSPEQILMSCSGRVGRITAVYPHHENIVVTHDLLRIVPRDANHYGWLYAYMRTTQFHGIASASQYGHMIKHLEPEHVQLMPVIMPSTEVVEKTSRLVALVLEKRREAAAIEAQANAQYESLINPGGGILERVVHGTVKASSLNSSRRRLDAEHFRPDYQQIEQLVLSAGTRPLQSLEDVTEKVSLGNRFRRYFGENGTSYRSAEELFDLNAPVTKRVYAGLVDNREKYTLKSGWIIMACSGQVYGLNGRVLLLTGAHDGIFGSHDLIRIIPRTEEIHTGYLLLVLGNPKYGRPLVIRNAYGTSIPHLDPVDVRDVPVPRFDAETERRLGDMMVRVAELKAESDRLENEATELAETVASVFVKSHGRQ